MVRTDGNTEVLPEWRERAGNVGPPPARSGDYVPFRLLSLDCGLNWQKNQDPGLLLGPLSLGAPAARLLGACRAFSKLTP